MATLDIDVRKFQRTAQALQESIARVIVGYEEQVHQVVVAMLAGGHCLIEGVPGLGKTMLVRTIADALDLEYSRIQFTPDLMPADITGTTIIHATETGDRAFRFEKGPIFANIVLADEINRATPKTQSALLEAMEEQTVTIAKQTYDIEGPFFVMATQNPIEMEGTYPLPEAQLDRFFFKISVGYPGRDDLERILERTTAGQIPGAEAVANRAEIEAMMRLARDVPIAGHVTRYAVELVKATHPDEADAPAITRRFVRYGSSPRGGQALVIAGKVQALMDGRLNVSYDDIRQAFAPAIRHRLLLNFEAEAEGVSTDNVLNEIAMKIRPEGGMGN